MAADVLVLQDGLVGPVVGFLQLLVFEGAPDADGTCAWEYLDEGIVGGRDEDFEDGLMVQ